MENHDRSYPEGMLYIKDDDYTSEYDIFISSPMIKFFHHLSLCYFFIYDNLISQVVYILSSFMIDFTDGIFISHLWYNSLIIYDSFIFSLMIETSNFDSFIGNKKNIYT